VFQCAFPIENLHVNVVAASTPKDWSGSEHRD